MAIIKKAKNINIQVANNYTSISKISHEECEEVIIEATKKNLELSSQKRAILQGFGKDSEKNEKKENGEIIEIYWSYGENNMRLSGDSKFYVDMNLIVQTRYYEEGESVEVLIKSDDNNPIADGISELKLTGKIDSEGMIFFKEPLKNYSLHLLKEEENENI